MKTVRVRIAVAVNSQGAWNSNGWGWADKQRPDADLVAGAFDGLPEDEAREHVVFVEADVPVPEPKTIEGTVTK